MIPRLPRAAVALAAAASLGCSSSASPRETGDDASARDAGVVTDAGPADTSTGCLVCGEASFPDAPLAVLVQGTMDQICGNADGCHGSGAGNFGFRPGGEFAAMIDVTSFENPPMKRVLPGDPLASYVYLKLACDGGIVGACMPLSSGFNPLIAKVFHDWIEAGAPLPPE